MKKLLYILLFIPHALFGQTIQDFRDCDFNSYCMPVTDNNMSVIFAEGTLSDFVGGSIMAFEGGVPISELHLIDVDGSVGIPVIGTDAMCGCDLADPGEEIQFAILINGQEIFHIETDSPVQYYANSIEFVGADYYPNDCDPFGIGHTDDCLSVLDIYPNFEVPNDPSWIYGSTIIPNNQIKFISVGCMDVNAINYNANASIQEFDQFNDIRCSYTSCADVPYNGCILTDPFNVFIQANNDFTYYECNDYGGIWCFYGCINPLAVNYDHFSTHSNDSCLFRIQGNEIIDSIGIVNNALNIKLEALNQSIDLETGWNIIGYNCITLDLVEALSEYIDKIILVKDNEGRAFLSEWDYNGIGDLNSGYGYQIKITESIEKFNLCDWYLNDIPEFSIVSLHDSIINMHTANCIDDGYCGFDEQTESCFEAEEGYDCDGNEITFQVGDFAQGGIVFYVDETGKHGLVAALEDLGFFEWGCNEESVNGADGQAIGTGYQNTLAIVNYGCITENGGVTAAQAALHAEINGYTDWYLPSIDELKLVFHNIAHGAVTNITNLNDGSYMSSTELSATMADGMNFWTNNVPSSFVTEDAGNIGPQFKNALYLICPIRSF